MAKERKTEKELEAIARERLGSTISVRRDVKGGWYFQRSAEVCECDIGKAESI